MSGEPSTALAEVIEELEEILEGTGACFMHAGGPKARGYEELMGHLGRAIGELRKANRLQEELLRRSSTNPPPESSPDRPKR